MEIHWTIIVGVVTIIAWYWFFHLKIVRPMTNRAQQTMFVTNDRDQQTEVVATTDRDQQTKAINTVDRVQQTKVIATVHKYQQTKVIATVDRERQKKVITTVDRDQQTEVAMGETPGIDVGSDFIEEVKDDIEKLENSPQATLFAEIFQQKGEKGLQQKLQDLLNSWKTTKLHVAVIGRTGVGKSSFINTFLKKKKTSTGSVETTKTCTSYCHPEHDNLELWDIPGVGTRSFPKETYLESITFQRYDFFLLMLSDRVEENDLWLMASIAKVGKKVYIIRTKLDQAMANISYDYPKQSKEEVFDILKNNIVKEFQSTNFDESRIFCICGHNDTLYEFQQLVSAMISDSSDLKRSAMTLSVSTLSDEIITAKVAELSQRIYSTALKASIGNPIPILKLGLCIQVAVLYNEAQFYRRQLGMDENTMLEIAERLNCQVEDLQVKLNMKMHIILRTETAFTDFLGTFEGTYLQLILPIIGQIITAGANYPLCVSLLKKLLSEIEKEARALNAYKAEWIERENPL